MFLGLCSPIPGESDFHKDPKCKDGFRPDCKACRKKKYDPEARRARYEQNRDRELKLKNSRYVKRHGKRGRKKKQENEQDGTR